jgi:hypothetical protein
LRAVSSSITWKPSYEVIEDRIDNRYYCFVFWDSHMVGSILLGDTTLASGVKEAVEKRIGCAKVLQQRPECWDILD